MRIGTRTIIIFAAAVVAGIFLLAWFIAHDDAIPPGQVVIAPDRDVRPKFESSSSLRAASTPARTLESAIGILEAEEPLGPDARSRASVRLAGDRYVLVSQPSASGVVDIIVDLQDQRSTAFVATDSYSFETSDGTIVYVEPKRVSVYRRDWPGFRVLRGSELGPYMSYSSAEGADFTPAESHTASIIRLGIFSDLSAEPDGYPPVDPATGQLRQIGELVLPFSS